MTTHKIDRTRPASHAQMLGWTIPEGNARKLLGAWRSLMAANSRVPRMQQVWLDGAGDHRRFSDQHDDRHCRNAWEGLVLGYWLARIACD